MRKGFIAVLLVIAVAMPLTACFGIDGDGQVTDAQRQTYDRAGNAITLPENIGSIISMGPSNTEILTALGFADLLVGVDSFSTNVEGVDQSLPLFDMWSPEVERIIDIFPDVVFATGMTMVGGLNPFTPASDLGITVIFIPSSDSIEGIIEDIRFIAEVMGAQERGEEIIAEMEETIASVRAVGKTIPYHDRKTVYFEISPAPWLYSFGRGVFLDELVNIVGAANILADHEGWMPVADEQIIMRNPDVILTNVDSIDNPVLEIMQRTGWNNITAVINEAVFVICIDASSHPSHNIVKALREIALAIYPEHFQDEY